MTDHICLKNANQFKIWAHSRQKGLKMENFHHRLKVPLSARIVFVLGYLNTGMGTTGVSISDVGLAQCIPGFRQTSSLDQNKVA